MLREQRSRHVRRGQRVLLGCLLDGNTATADNVREAVELPPDIDPKLFGSVPGPLSRAGIIEADGFVKTNRPTAHARPITRWRLRDAAKAREWLAANPDYLDDAPDDDLPLFAATRQKSPTVAAAGPVNPLTPASGKDSSHG